MSKKMVGTNGTGGSAAQGTSTGSGSRPGNSKYPIATSAPSDQRGMTRPPAGWLK